MSNGLDWKKWDYGIAKSFIGGGASAISAWFGSVGLNTIGVNIPIIHWTQVIAMFVAAGVVHMVSYLKDCPVPPCDGKSKGKRRKK